MDKKELLEIVETIREEVNKTRREMVDLHFKTMEAHSRMWLKEKKDYECIMLTLSKLVDKIKGE